MSQACGSTSFILAVCKSVATVAQPTAANPEQCVLPSNCLRSDGALDNVGIDFDPPIAQEAFESGPPGDGVADRLGEFGFPGQARQFRFPQVEEPCHNGGDLSWRAFMLTASFAEGLPGVANYDRPRIYEVQLALLDAFQEKIFRFCIGIGHIIRQAPCSISSPVTMACLFGHVLPTMKLNVHLIGVFCQQCLVIKSATASLL